MEQEEIITVYRERVDRGMAWIKENADRLNLDLDRVELDRLDMESPYDCVLGQAGRVDGVGAGWYRLHDAGELTMDMDLCGLGFMVDWRLSLSDVSTAAELNDAWRNAILTERDR